MEKVIIAKETLSNYRDQQFIAIKIDDLFR